MPVPSVDQVYEQYVRILAEEDRLRLVELIARGIAEEHQRSRPPQRSIMELHGLGAEIWRGVDAQQYVNSLRQEWDHRP